MGGNRKLIGETARAMCEQYPDMSSLALARMLKRDHPALFADNEHARHVVRYYRGANGDYNREKTDRSKSRVARYDVPESDAKEYAPFILPDEPRRYLVISDIHAPYHVEATIKAILAYAKHAHCDGVILLGDVIDCYQLSSFDRNPDNRSFAKELDAVANLFDAIQNTLRPKRFIWKAGNHELRLHRFLLRRARRNCSGRIRMTSSRSATS